MMEIGRGGACVSARVAPQGRIHRSFPAHNACIFGVETPLDVRAGTQAPPLRFRLGRLRVEWLISFGWITRGWLVLFGGLRVDGWCCLVDCVWMSALTHFVWEVIFANVATRVCEWMCGEIKPVGLVLLPAQGCRRKEATLGKGGGREPMPSALYFLKSICVWGNHPFVAGGNVSFLMVLDGQNQLKGHTVHCGRWLLHI